MFFSFTHSKNKNAFTLIEVLVVITIIGILMSILVLNFEESRKRARDNVRKSDLKSLQLALEVYKAQNGRYPAAGCGAGNGIWAGPGPFSAGGQITCEDYIVGLIPDYIAELPKDKNEYDLDKGYQYVTTTDGSVYKVMDHNAVEVNFVTSYADEFARCPANNCTGNPGCPAGGVPQSSVYAVYSKGTECW